MATILSRHTLSAHHSGMVCYAANVHCRDRPDLAAPIATHTGWKPRATAILLALIGSTLPFGPDAERRAATDDPRPAIAERYHDRDDYLAKVGAATDQLIARRAILAEDRAWAIALAAKRFDALVAAQRADS